MSDHKKCKKTNIKTSTKWQIPNDLLQMECSWNEELYFPCNYGNEIYQLVDELFEEKKSALEL
jgi:hypothetical protein